MIHFNVLRVLFFGVQCAFNYLFINSTYSRIEKQTEEIEREKPDKKETFVIMIYRFSYTDSGKIGLREIFIMNNVSFIATFYILY